MARTALVLSLIAGCSDPAPVADAPATADAAPDTAVDTCPAGQLCFRVNKVVPGATIPDGRLVVVFRQFNDNITPQPIRQITLDRAFDGTATTIEFPLSDIGLPTPIDDYRLCSRTCSNISMPQCDCIAAEAKVALAVVLVIRDVDMSGTIEQAELDTSANRYGGGYMQIGAADQAYPNPQMLQHLFLEGIEDGLVPYRVIESGLIDDLGIAAPGMVFDLNVCVPGDASCDSARPPNLT